jgi:hypothetical protein
VAQHIGAAEAFEGGWLKARNSVSISVSAPVNWEPGEDVIIVDPVSDEEAKKVYPEAGARRGRIGASSHSPGPDDRV